MKKQQNVNHDTDWWTTFKKKKDWAESGQVHYENERLSMLEDNCSQVPNSG